MMNTRYTPQTLILPLYYLDDDDDDDDDDDVYVLNLLRCDGGVARAGFGVAKDIICTYNPWKERV
eukprot:15354011-Ditylum_brightwellii.AAC.1